MFKCSEILYSVKYTNYIGDGDFKTFLDAEPYENCLVTKKECIDHIQKQMGTCLRNLKKKETRGLGGKGKLTGKLIDELFIHYGLSVEILILLVLDIAATIAVCVYNNGLTNIMKSMELLGMEIELNCYNFCMQADACRIKFLERSPTTRAKEAELFLKSDRKEKEEEKINSEGQLYGAGIAD